MITFSKSFGSSNVFFQIKCFQYWPSVEDNEEEYGQFEVQHLEENILPNYTVRIFYLREKKTGERRKVTQFHYQMWSTSDSTPTDVEGFLEFIEEVSESHSGKCPVVVHCRCVGCSLPFLLVPLSFSSFISLIYLICLSICLFIYLLLYMHTEFYIINLLLPNTVKKLCCKVLITPL